MLIHPERGSYFLLAEILLGIELEQDLPFATDHCGNCTRCIEACPTDCILPDRTLDAGRCISYLTIEVKESMSSEVRGQMENWVFGCDICQMVCPWNERFAQKEGDHAFSLGEGSRWLDLETELQISASEFNNKFKGSPVWRAKRRGNLRNVAVALGNSANPSSVLALSVALLNDTETLVRGHAAWALGKIGGTAADQVLKEAAAQEKDVWVLEEIQGALKKIATNN